MKKNGNNPTKGKPTEGRTKPKAKNKIESRRVDRVHSKCVFMARRPQC